MPLSVISQLKEACKTMFLREALCIFLIAERVDILYPYQYVVLIGTQDISRSVRFSD